MYAPDPAEVLTPEALEFVAELQREFAGGATSSCSRAPSARRESTPASCPDFLARDARDPRGATGGSRPRPADLQRPARRDHRPGRPQDGDQRAQLGREGLHGRLRGRALADLGERRRGPGQPARRRRAARSRSTRRRARRTGSTTTIATLLVRPRGWHLDEQHVARRRRAGLGEPLRLRRSTSSTTRASCSRAARGPYFYLPKLESHLEARLWNDVFVLRAGARSASRAARSGRPC